MPVDRYSAFPQDSILDRPAATILTLLVAWSMHPTTWTKVPAATPAATADGVPILTCRDDADEGTCTYATPALLARPRYPPELRTQVDVASADAVGFEVKVCHATMTLLTVFI